MPASSSRSKASKKSSKTVSSKGSASSKGSVSSKNAGKEALASQNPSKVQKASSTGSSAKAKSVAAASTSSKGSAKSQKPFVATQSFRNKAPSSSGKSSSDSSANSGASLPMDPLPEEPVASSTVSSESPSAIQERELDDSKKLWANDRLLVVTNEKVIAFAGLQGHRVIFVSGNQSIKSAMFRRDDETGSMLAVMDSQGTIIHDMGDEFSNSAINLTCDEAQISHNGSFLIFTSPICNNAHIYDIYNKEMLPQGKVHDSPIDCMAISVNEDLLLTTSSSPPTINIENLLMGTHRNFVFDISNSPVVACAWHPTRNCTFLLVFKDGKIAAFDYNRIRVKGQGLIGSVENPHSATLGGTGLVSIKFVPHTKAVAVSVGEDSRVRMIDFSYDHVESEEFNLHAPATALAIRHRNYDSSLWQGTIAVSTKLGDIYLLDKGLKLLEKSSSLNKDGDIIDLQFTTQDITTSWRNDAGNDFDPSHLPNFTYSDSRQHVEPLPLPDYIEEAATEAIGLGDEVNSSDVQGLENTAGDMSYMNTFSPIKQDHPKRRSARLSSSGGKSVTSDTNPSSAKPPILKQDGIYPTVSAPQLSSAEPVQNHPSQQQSINNTDNNRLLSTLRELNAATQNMDTSGAKSSKAHGPKSATLSTASTLDGAAATGADGQSAADLLDRILKSALKANVYNTFKPTAAASSDSKRKRNEDDDESSPAADSVKRSKSPPRDIAPVQQQDPIEFPADSPPWLPFLVNHMRDDFRSQLQAQSLRFESQIENLKSDIGQRFDEIHGSLNNIAECCGSIETKVKSTDTKLNVVHQNQSMADQKLQTISSSCNSIAENLRTLKWSFQTKSHNFKDVKREPTCPESCNSDIPS